MVRIQVPAVVAAAALALAACSSLGGGYAPYAVGGATFDPVLFPPPPPMPPEPRGALAAGRDMREEIAGLAAAVERLSADVEANRRRLAALTTELQRTRARIEALLAAGAPTSAASPAIPGEPGGDRRPLVRIRYDRPSVDHADAVRTAVGAALARLPDAAFDLVAVTAAEDGATANAGAADEAWAHAEEVMADLLEMGLAADRLTLSAAGGPGADVGEVRIYVR